MLCDVFVRYAKLIVDILAYGATTVVRLLRYDTFLIIEFDLQNMVICCKSNSFHQKIIFSECIEG